MLGSQNTFNNSMKGEKNMLDNELRSEIDWFIKKNLNEQFVEKYAVAHFGSHIYDDNGNYREGGQEVEKYINEAYHRIMDEKFYSCIR